MSEFFHNLSLQALSIEDDRIYITFEAMNKIHQIIADNLSILKFEFMKYEIDRNFEDDKKFRDTIVPIETSTNVTETDLVQTILKDEKATFPDDNSQLPFPQTPEEIKKEEKNKNKFINDQLKINHRDFETINNLIDEDKKELQNSFNDKKEIPIKK